MSKRSISIERLEIRLRGISQEAAREAAGELGRDILGQLASGQNPPGASRAVSKVDAGTISAGAATGARELRGLIAGRIAASLKSKMK